MHEALRSRQLELSLQGSAINSLTLLVYGALSSRLLVCAALRAWRTFELSLQGSATSAEPLNSYCCFTAALLLLYCCFTGAPST
jgi:hypothetical protein